MVRTADFRLLSESDNLPRGMAMKDSSSCTVPTAPKVSSRVLAKTVDKGGQKALTGSQSQGRKEPDGQQDRKLERGEHLDKKGSLRSREG